MESIFSFKGSHGACSSPYQIRFLYWDSVILLESFYVLHC